MTEQSLAQLKPTELERDQRKGDGQEQRDHRSRDHLYDALASMDMETRLATINRLAERLGV